MKSDKVYLLKTNGSGYGDGDGDGSGYGDGYGSGYGDGDGSGYGDGDGSGSGYGSGDGDGDGSGSGDGDGVYIAKIWEDWFEVSREVENSLCVNIPSHHYGKIDKDFINKVNNLESLRSLREKIGLDRYIQLLDAKVINTQTDNQGNEMKLYKYDEKGTKVVLLEVVCPSTKRMYHLYPPNQKSVTCMEAKASTFGMNIKEFNPFSES